MAPDVCLGPLVFATSLRTELSRSEMPGDSEVWLCCTSTAEAISCKSVERGRRPCGVAIPIWLVFGVGEAADPERVSVF